MRGPGRRYTPQARPGTCECVRGWSVSVRGGVCECEGVCVCVCEGVECECECVCVRAGGGGECELGKVRISHKKPVNDNSYIQRTVATTI